MSLRTKNLHISGNVPQKAPGRHVKDTGIQSIIGQKETPTPANKFINMKTKIVRYMQIRLKLE